MAERQRDQELERTWRRHIERQRASGLSVREYCFDHDLAKASFYYWRRTISERDRQATSAAATAPAFVPVRLIDAPVRPDSSAIDIRLCGGQRLRVRAGCDQQLLAAVVALLEGRPC